MKKIPIVYSKAEGERWSMLSSRCPNGMNCFVGSAWCMNDCKYCDKKNSIDYKYVMCKLDHKQLDLFSQ